MTARQQVLLLAALAAGTSGCAPAGDTLQGCGATFPAPLYKRWFLEYYRAHPTVRTNYQPIGSGAGLRQLSEGLVHFGASDESQDAKKLKAMAEELGRREGVNVELLQVPMTAGSVALCYNVPGDPDLRLSRKAYVGVLLGEVTYWDDEPIARTNPGVGLPHLPITFIRRAESSGTTFAFTNHLSAVDARWRKPRGPGAGKSVQWRVGLGGKGNAGVAALIQQTPGALGYIEAGYAELTHLPMAALENKRGQYVRPGAYSALRALEKATFDKVYRAEVPDPDADGAYPIVTFTWVICRKHYRDPRVGAALRDVLRYCLTEGQALSEELGYVPLPGFDAGHPSRPHPGSALAGVLRAVEEVGGQDQAHSLTLLGRDGGGR